jgi:hypothetical protein
MLKNTREETKELYMFQKKKINICKNNHTIIKNIDDDLVCEIKENEI